MFKFNRSLSCVLVPITRRLLSDKVVTLAINTEDVIDNFTTELVQKHSSKWEIRVKHIAGKSCNMLKSIEPIDLSAMSELEVNELIAKALAEGNEERVKYLIGQCLESSICPNRNLVISLFEFNIKDVGMVIKLQELVKKNNDYLSMINGHFDYYLGESLWLNGEILKALPLFESVYKKHGFLRRKIRLTFKYLILDVTNRSEAVLVNVIKFCERIMTDFRDDYLMACTWQACFMSEWYTDQQLALQLLDTYSNLRHAIVSQVPIIVQIALRSHQVEVVQRLLEVLMQHHIESQYCYVVMALFNYKFQQRDLRSCSEIINWAVINDIKLPSSFHQKFLMMLLKKNEPIKTEVIPPQSADYPF